MVKKELSKADKVFARILFTSATRARNGDFKYADSEIRNIKGLLHSHFGKESLRPITRQLLQLGFHLKNTTAPKAGAQLLEELKWPRLIDALNALAKSRDDKASKGLSDFARFEDRKVTKRGPMSGEEKPENAVSMDELGIPKKI